jgi:solute carrier family 25, member 38
VQHWFGAPPSHLSSISSRLFLHTSNVPGVAFYFTSLTYLRSIMAKSPYFSAHQRHNLDNSKSVLPKLSSQGNLIAGATARVGVGFILNPFSVLKARFEVSASL